MDSGLPADKDSYRLVHLKSGFSPSYITGNLVKSDTHIAYAKNGSLKSRVIIYKLEDIDNQDLDPENMKFKTVEWEAKAAECTHINYVCLNNRWYLLLGFVGSFEVYSEDGSKRYHKGQASDWGKNDMALRDSAFISSCVGHHYDENPQNAGQVTEYLMMGTTLGEIFQMQITKDNSVLQKYDKKNSMEGQQITALACNNYTGTMMAGSSDGFLFHFQIQYDEALTLLKTHEANPSEPVCVNSIQFLPVSSEFEKGSGFFVAGMANGLVKIINSMTM